MTTRITRFHEIGRLAPVASFRRRSPVLVVRDPADGSVPMRIAARLRRRNLVSISGSAVAEEGRGKSSATIERTWSGIEEEFHPASIGLVATARCAPACAARILTEGWSDGRIPGAIAILGYAPSFVATCLGIADRFATRSWTRPELGNALPVRTDWPAILFLSREDDPSIVECVGAAGRLRSAGIPVDVEVLDATRTTDRAAQAIDAFFEHHLVPDFPKRI